MQTRKGYLAVKTPLPVPVLPYEAPALARLDRSAEARRGPILFYREVRLPAGNYTLEAVAWDAKAGEAGVAAAALEVPRAAPGRLRDAGRPLAFFLRAWPAAEGPGVDARVGSSAGGGPSRRPARCAFGRKRTAASSS